MAEEGWYADPQDETRLRYWNGVEWTEHTHDRRDQPPFVPESDSDLGRPTVRPGQLNDIGVWLRRTFRVGLAKLAQCGLLTALGFVPAVFFYAIAYLALSEISDAGGLQGTTAVMIVLLAVVFIVWMLWVGVVMLAQNHLLYHTHIGNRVSLGQSIQAGFQGVGRLTWAYLTLVVYLLMVMAVVGGLTFLFALVSDTLGGVFFVVAYVAALTLSVWLAVKLIFMVVAAAVAPPGDRPMAVSVETTDGYFWAVLGRLLLLGLILSVALVPVMLIFGALFGTLGASFIDDPGSGTATALVGAIAVGGVLYLLVTMATQVFSASGIVRLYIDLDGPAQPVRPAQPEPAAAAQR